MTTSTSISANSYPVVLTSNQTACDANEILNKFENVSEEYRPKPILPKHNLSMKDSNNKENKNGSGSDGDAMPPRPSSAMSDAFQPMPKEAYRKIQFNLLKLLLSLICMPNIIKI